LRFAAEIWLWLVPLLPAVWLLFRAADRRAAVRLADLLGPRAAGHVEGDNPRLRSWRRFLFLAGLFWLLLALARPQWGASEVTVTQQGSDIVVALDISNSMLAEDVVPNRMESAKAELGSFLERLENSRVGLVFFAGAAFVQCPLTLDYGTAEIFLKMAGPDMMSEQGTDIGAALEASRELLAKGRGESATGSFQAILLVTDGEDLEGEWKREAEACRDADIRVIPVGVGDEGGGLIPVLDNLGRPAGFLKDEEGNVVTTHMDLSRLQELASIGGGSAFRLGIDGLAGDRLFAELERLGRRDLEDRRISAYQERFVWPLLLAMVCFAVRFLLRSRQGPGPADGPAWRRSRGVGTAVARTLVIGLVIGVAAGQASRAAASLAPPELSDMNSGQKLYAEGDYEGALAAFESALVQAPDNPVIGLAVGETLFRLERYEEAADEFDRVLGLTDDPDLRAEALYNRGTAALAAGDPAAAVDRLRESLRIDPAQEDALHNLEVALERLQQQEQQQQQQQDQQQQESHEQDEQEQQDQEHQPGDDPQQDQQSGQQEQQEPQQQQQEPQQQQPEPEERQQDEQQQQPDPEEQPQDESAGGPQESGEDQEQPPVDPEGLTKEQQEQILKALDRDEEELKRSVQKRLKGGKAKSGKKW
jgi:Ca-activated chloride channel family protein